MNFISFKKIAIIGTGFMGTSLGLAIKEKQIADNITGMDINNDNIQSAKNLGAVDISESNLETACKNKDLVILALPVSQIMDILPRVASSIKENCLVTDLGSTKVHIIKKANQFFKNNKYFVGSHPMSGSVKSGPDTADGDIFENRICFVCIDKETNYSAASDIVLFWRSINLTTVITSPERHDHLACLVSHLPYISSVALLKTIQNLLKEDMNFSKKIIGNGFLSSTKMSESNTSVWNDIVLSNPDNIIDSLETLRDEITNILNKIKSKDTVKIKDYFLTAQNYRKEFDK